MATDDGYSAADRADIDDMIALIVECVSRWYHADVDLQPDGFAALQRAIEHDVFGVHAHTRPVLNPPAPESAE